MRSLTERERKILDLLMEDGQLSVTDISDRLRVSKVTIRSDFAGLVEKGVLIKTRGGNFPAFHPEILERQKNMTQEKHRIARAAASLVEDGDTLMIHAGTTTALTAQYLLGKRDIRVVSNSSLLLPYARISPSLHLTLVGGEFRPQAESLVGPQALKQLAEYHVKIAFIGTEGFSLEAGITSQLAENAETIRMMVSLADKVVLLADSSKYNKPGFVKILPLSVSSLIITDSDLPESARKELADEGLQLKIV